MLFCHLALSASSDSESSNDFAGRLIGRSSFALHAGRFIAVEPRTVIIQKVEAQLCSP